jgi:DNA (cytosine-5)-methyltransferase 1
MNIAGLFAGVGGFELGMALTGHRAEMLCEISPTARAVLAKRFPDAPIEPDVATLPDLPASTQIVTAGFPCQDLSQAGRTAGLAGHRSGLIGEVFRLLEKRRNAGYPVEWVVVENVPFMLQLGGGAAMRAIITEFERLGYRWAYRVVDSFSFGLAQRRERVFLVASLVEDPARILLVDDKPIPRPPTQLGVMAHGFYWTEGLGGLGWAVDAVPTLKNGSTIGIPSPPAILLADGQLVRPGIRTAERLQGFNADWTLPAEAVAKSSSRWALVGSAVSVPVPAWIGGRINEPGEYEIRRDREFPVSGKAPKAARFDGSRRFQVDISTDPIGLRGESLSSIMGNDYTLLSVKAASGFLGRARRAKLRFPEGFLAAVERHVQFMTGPAGSETAARAAV